MTRDARPPPGRYDRRPRSVTENGLQIQPVTVTVNFDMSNVGQINIRMPVESIERIAQNRYDVAGERMVDRRSSSLLYDVNNGMFGAPRHRG